MSCVSQPGIVVRNNCMFSLALLLGCKTNGSIKAQIRTEEGRNDSSSTISAVNIDSNKENSAFGNLRKSYSTVKF